ncbi:amino acid ABC transporter permease [Bradyrhizobium sp. 180]|nr:amino acid ABC transporter permease [Bradyrhizobium sp. 180]
MFNAVWDWFRWLNDAYGINLTIFYDPFDRQRFLYGVVTTVLLSVVCIVISIVVGVIGAWLQMSRKIFVRTLVQAYVQFFRNTPSLIQLYFFYFAVDTALSHLLGLRHLFGSFGWAVLALSLFAGAFNVELFRSGIEAVPKTMIEAAESLGYSRLGVYRYVILPLALRICLPALNNNLVNLVKTTTLAYAISVPETLWVSSQIWGDQLNTVEMMNVVLAVYLLVVGVLVFAMNRWERALQIPGFGDRQ